MDFSELLSKAQENTTQSVKGAVGYSSKLPPVKKLPKASVNSAAVKALLEKKKKDEQAKALAEQQAKEQREKQRQDESTTKNKKSKEKDKPKVKKGHEFENEDHQRFMTVVENEAQKKRLMGQSNSTEPHITKDKKKKKKHRDRSKDESPSYDKLSLPKHKHSHQHTSDSKQKLPVEGSTKEHISKIKKPNNSSSPLDFKALLMLAEKQQATPATLTVQDLMKKANKPSSRPLGPLTARQKEELERKQRRRYEEKYGKPMPKPQSKEKEEDENGTSSLQKDPPSSKKQNNLIPAKIKGKEPVEKNVEPIVQEKHRPMADYKGKGAAMLERLSVKNAPKADNVINSKKVSKPSIGIPKAKLKTVDESSNHASAGHSRYVNHGNGKSSTGMKQTPAKEREPDNRSRSAESKLDRKDEKCEVRSSSKKDKSKSSRYIPPNPYQDPQRSGLAMLHRLSNKKEKEGPMLSRHQVLGASDEEDYDSEMDDFIDDGEEEMDYSTAIRDIFGYDKRRYRDFDDDADDMEAKFTDIMKEEARSARLGRQEDLEDIRREEEELKRKAKRLKRS